MVTTWVDKINNGSVFGSLVMWENVSRQQEDKYTRYNVVLYVEKRNQDFNDVMNSLSQ